MDFLSLLLWPIFGLVVGAIARFLVPGKQSMGWIATMILGIVGSLVGGFLGNLLFGDGGFEISAAGLIGSVIGAVIVLLIYVFATRKSV